MVRDQERSKKLKFSPSTFHRSERSEREIGWDRDFSRRGNPAAGLFGPWLVRSGKAGWKVSFKRGETRRWETGEQVFASFTVT